MAFLLGIVIGFTGALGAATLASAVQDGDVAYGIGLIAVCVAAALGALRRHWPSPPDNPVDLPDPPHSGAE